MNARNDGGPAFPLPDAQPNGNGDVLHPLQPGMSLRDYFAGQVLEGSMSGASGLGNMDPATRTKLLDDCSALFYEIADAMLRARDAA
jgi:hypothetical protein